MNLASFFSLHSVKFLKREMWNIKYIVLLSFSPKKNLPLDIFKTFILCFTSPDKLHSSYLEKEEK